MAYRVMLFNKVIKCSDVWVPCMMANYSSEHIHFKGLSYISAFHENTSEEWSMIQKEEASLSWSILVEEILFIAFLMCVYYIVVST